MGVWPDMIQQTNLTQQQRIRTQNDEFFVARRPLPIGKKLIAATTSGTAETFYTVRDKKMFEIKRLVVSNTSGSAATLTLHAIPSGDSIGTANTELAAKSVAANDAMDLTDLVGGLYDAGTELKVYAGTTNVLIIDAWGEEIS